MRKIDLSHQVEINYGIRSLRIKWTVDSGCFAVQFVPFISSVAQRHNYKDTKCALFKHNTLKAFEENSD